MSPLLILTLSLISYCFLKKSLLIVSILVIAVCARPDTKPEDYEAQIEQTDFKVNDESGYKVKYQSKNHRIFFKFIFLQFGYKTSNNIKIEEESDGRNIVEGSYSYASL